MNYAYPLWFIYGHSGCLHQVSESAGCSPILLTYEGCPLKIHLLDLVDNVFAIITRHDRSSTEAMLDPPEVLLSV